MAGDRARVSYDPSRKWRGLIAQQGRVTVEADWNEAATIDAERDRQLTLDVVGTVGTPDGGYAVTAVPATGGLSGSTPGRSRHRAGHALPGWRAAGPRCAGRTTARSPTGWTIRPIRSGCPRPCRPGREPATSSSTCWRPSRRCRPSRIRPSPTSPSAARTRWQRQRILQHFVRQPSRVGFVLPDRGARWRAPWRRGAAVRRRVDDDRVGDDPEGVVHQRRGRAGPCQPAATGGYLGAENQMIRVMVTSVDPSGVPTIVWGFDDASFLYRVQAASVDPGSGDTTLTLASAPVDSYHYPAQGQAVELLRRRGPAHRHRLHRVAGRLRQPRSPLATPRASMSLAISGEPPGDYLSAATPQLYLRVWQATTRRAGGSGDPARRHRGRRHAHLEHRQLPRRRLLALRAAADPADDRVPGPLPRRAAAARRPADLGLPAGGAGLGRRERDGDRLRPAVLRPRAGRPPREGGCCTVDVGPSDVDDGASLQALLDQLRDPGTGHRVPGAGYLHAPGAARARVGARRPHPAGLPGRSRAAGAEPARRRVRPRAHRDAGRELGHDPGHRAVRSARRVLAPCRLLLRPAGNRTRSCSSAFSAGLQVGDRHLGGRLRRPHHRGLHVRACPIRARRTSSAPGSSRPGR